MTSSLQLVSRKQLRAVTWALASTILLLLTVGPTSSAQATAFKTLYTFTGGADGAIPQAGVINVNGISYGTTSGGGDFQSGTVYQVTKAGQETVLYSFAGSPDGAGPQSALVRDSQSNLYGTTSVGGAFGAGTVFKLEPTGTETVLYSFTGGADGQGPNGLVRDPQGNLYGTTAYGGISCSVLGFCGIVFKLDTAGGFTVLHTFTGPPDGAQPAAGLIRDAGGNLYGTTLFGGNAPGGDNGPCGLGGCGTVFKVDTSAKETVLYAFCATGGSCPDGIFPAAGLIRDGAGSFYATTEAGGTYGWGTVFKLWKPGKVTVLYTFTGGSDGGLPKGRLAHDAHGALYGTTYFGGLEKKSCDSANSGCGVVFKITATGKETVLHTFTGDDGGNPVAGLVWDAEGNLYGTSLTGHQAGTVFQLTP